MGLRAEAVPVCGKAIRTLRNGFFSLKWIFSSAVLVVLPSGGRTSAQATNMVLLGHNDLGAPGDGGEGMAVQILDGRRILKIADPGTRNRLGVEHSTIPGIQLPSASCLLPIPASRRATHWAFPVTSPVVAD